MTSYVEGCPALPVVTVQGLRSPRETVRKVSVEPESRPYGRTKRAKKPYFAVLPGQKARSKRKLAQKHSEDRESYTGSSYDLRKIVRLGRLKTPKRAVC